LLAAAAMGDRSDSPYTPLYVRAVHAPRPWGVTALLSDYTGSHQPLEVDWSVATDGGQAALRLDLPDAAPAAAAMPAIAPPVVTPDSKRADGPVVRHDETPNAANDTPAFASFWEFAVAVNR